MGLFFFNSLSVTENVRKYNPTAKLKQVTEYIGRTKRARTKNLVDAKISWGLICKRVDFLLIFSFLFVLRSIIYLIPNSGVLHLCDWLTKPTLTCMLSYFFRLMWKLFWLAVYSFQDTASIKVYWSIADKHLTDNNIESSKAIFICMCDSYKKDILACGYSVHSVHWRKKSSSKIVSSSCGN